MSWLSRLKAARGGAQALSAQAEQTLRTWHALPDAVLDHPHFESRYVVVNTEATGLDLDSDRLLAVVGEERLDGGEVAPCGRGPGLGLAAHGPCHDAPHVGVDDGHALSVGETRHGARGVVADAG